MLPALVLAVTGTAVAVEASWLLLGAHLEVDEVGRSFLLLSATLWGLAALFAHGYVRQGRPQFTAFWLVTLSGNLMLILAGDALTFYMGFVVMTFAGYGLVVHERTAEALRAGRIYVVMAMLGEAALLAGILAAVWASTGALQFAELRSGLVESEHRVLIVGLILAGFGVKAGVAGLHMWLPLAHPAAPVPASAVLSGVMIKAAVLGWLGFVPGEESSRAGDLVPWGTALVTLGAAGAILAVLAGLTHRDPKVTLAYSSVSQVGVITMAVGMGLSATAGVGIVSAVAFYALHHGLAKGALFLGILLTATRGVTRGAVLAGLTLCVVTVAAGPMTSGMIAKGMLKASAAEAASTGDVVALLLPLTSVATTVLLSRYLWLVWRTEAVTDARHRWSLPASCALVATSFLVVWAVPSALLAGVEPQAGVYAGAIIDATWPLAIGVALFAGGTLIASRTQAERFRVPPADVIEPIEAALRAVVAADRWLAPRTLEAGGILRVGTRRLTALVLAGDSVEGALNAWTSAAFLFVLLIALFVLLGGW